MERLTVFCAEVAAVRSGEFAWARNVASDPGQPAAIEHQRGSAFHLAAAVAGELSANRPVALGFECPLFVPVPAPARALGAPRVGEAGRTWSSSNGATALANGVVQIAWALAAIRERCPNRGLHIDWSGFAKAGTGLLIWEAFVTAKARAVSHGEGAAIAVAAFLDSLPDPTVSSGVAAERPLSLAGAVALWSGWLSDLDVLREAPLVIRPQGPTELVRRAAPGAIGAPLRIAETNGPANGWSE